MALTAQESLRLLYGAPGLVYQVRTYLRCDQVGTHSGMGDVSTPVVVVDAAVGNQIVVGDILQLDDEDMRVVSKTSGVVIGVTRAYAGTTASAHPAVGTAWVWKDVSDFVTNDHGIAAVSSIRRSFEKNIDSFETSAADLKALNKDRFWDRVTLPTGITSYRHHWIRFYIRTLRGAMAVDHRALATLMISDVVTDDSDAATIKLVGIGALLREKQDADIVRFGREHFVYTPTSLVVRGILEKIEEFRYVGFQQYNGIPSQWQRELSSRAGRTISLPPNTSTVSHFGRPNEWRRLESYDLLPSGPILARETGYPTAPMPGAFPTALCYDPQVVGVGNVSTGDLNRPGRWYIGIGSDLWEFDEVTLQAEPRLNQIAGSNAWRIRRLWYNPLDTATAGKPKICGAAWADYPSVLAVNHDFAQRTVACRLFRWNGGSSPSNNFDPPSGNTQFWPGTHDFRAGTGHGLGGIVAGNPNQGENVSLPFAQRIGCFDMAQINLFGGIRQYENTVDQYGNQLAYRYQPNQTGTAANFEPGIVHDAINNSITGGGVPAALNRAFYGIFGSTVDDNHNFKFTQGQMGAMDYVGDPSLGASWCDKGAILFCTMDITTGVITVKAWDVVDSTVTTIYNALTQPYQQPIAICGNEGAWSSGRCYAIAWMEWSETGNSTAKIVSSNLDNTTRTTVYDAQSDSSYLSPIWMQLVEGTFTPPKLIVTFYSRVQTARPEQYWIRGFKADTAYTGITADLKTGSCWHAYCRHPVDKDVAYALDSGGRLLKCFADPIFGNIVPGTTTIFDRGFAPIDGENWSANHKLIAKSSDKVYGCSFPYWPFGDDIRGFRREGRYIMWKHDTNMLDNTELAYFKDKTMEEAMADLAFSSLSVWGFDKDGRGNFTWDDRIKTTTPVVSLGDKADRTTRMTKRRGYEEIENQVEITPVTFRDGEIRASIDLTSRKTVPISETTVNTKAAPQPIDVQALDPKQVMVALKCIQGGRVGAARFSYYFQGGTLKGWLANSYDASSVNGVIAVAGTGRSFGSPYNELASDDRSLGLQIPNGSIVHLPDGQEKVVSSVSPSVGWMTVVLASSWTPTQKIYAGAPVDIDLEIDRNLTSSISTAVLPDGKDVLTSSFEWQELGAGTKWASGILIRFLEPPDNGFDINYKEVSWHVGDLITIEVPGLELVQNSNSKVVAFDYDSIKKYGKRTYDSQRGNLLARRAFYISNARLQINKRPRWIWNVETHLAPYLALFDVVRLYNPKLNPVAPYTDDATIRSITHDVARGVTRFEAIGSFHD